MPGPNMVLDKGLKATAAIKQFYCCILDTTTKEQVSPTSSLGGQVVGVCQEEITTAFATRGRVGNIRIMGISRVVADAAYPIGTRVRTAADGRVTALAATTANQNQVGILTTATGAANDQADCILTPGVQIST